MSESPAFVALEFPTWIQWGVRAGAKLPYPKGRGANGRGLCRWCHAEVPKGSQSWCSRAHVDAFLRVSGWGALSQYIIGRDRVCQKCGTDHPGWNRSRSLFRRELVHARYGWVETRTVVREQAYWREFHTLTPWWEVDHILPVKDGGTDDPANLRLLCHACHVVAGIEQRRARKAKAAPELDLICGDAPAGTGKQILTASDVRGVA